MKKIDALLVCIALVTLVIPLQAYTTEVHVVKYAADGTTILNETTVNYTWMRDNLPVMGEENLYGTNYTHHYFQGPTFDEGNPWDPPEEVNVESRDYGAVAGTDIKDLCELVGGMSPGDEVKIKAIDPFYKWFNYTNVYNNRDNETLNSRQGPMVLAWYNGNESITGEPQGVGYPDTGYSVGMRLHFFADNSTNPEGYHCFGLWDMHECLAEEYWHYYDGYPGFVGWPSSSGLSVKWVGSILIYSSETPEGLCGDVNKDGVVNVLDATKVKNRAGNPSYPLDDEWAADVNCDGSINVLDATKVKNHAGNPGYPLDCCTN